MPQKAAEKLKLQPKIHPIDGKWAVLKNCMSEMPQEGKFASHYG